MISLNLEVGSTTLSWEFVPHRKRLRQWFPWGFPGTDQTAPYSLNYNRVSTSRTKWPRMPGRRGSAWILRATTRDCCFSTCSKTTAQIAQQTWPFRGIHPKSFGISMYSKLYDARAVLKIADSIKYQASRHWTPLLRRTTRNPLLAVRVLMLDLVKKKSRTMYCYSATERCRPALPVGVYADMFPKLRFVS